MRTLVGDFTWYDDLNTFRFCPNLQTRVDVTVIFLSSVHIQTVPLHIISLYGQVANTLSAFVIEQYNLLPASKSK